jgi:O-acetyl-ADP-ribose deacetylase (regulator of RNase III)
LSHFYYLTAKDVGDVAVLKRDERFVYYLITKSRYFDRPTYETLEDSLKAMKTHCVTNNVKALSMPKIGCGLDKLEWDQVEAILTRLFQDTGIVITIYSF